MRKRRPSLSPLFLSLVVVLSGFAYLLLKFLPTEQKDELLSKLRALTKNSSKEQFPVTKDSTPSVAYINTPMPASSMIVDEPVWDTQPGKQRFLQPEARLEFKDARQQNLRLDKLNSLASDAQGRIYALHREHLKVHVFSAELQPLAQWSLELTAGKFLRAPIALTVFKDRIVVAGADGEVGWWQNNGTFIRPFKFSGSIYDVEAFANGDLLLMTPGNRYLLHRVSKEGVEKLAFALRDSGNSTTARFFDQGAVAILPDESVIVSYEYPYRLEFYDPKGHPIQSLTHPLTLTKTPPEFERDAQGRIIRVLRQPVAYDLKVAPEGLIYHVVRFEGEGGGDQWHVFSANGEFLQRFYLPYNQRAICFANGGVYVLGIYPSVLLEKLYIETLTDASQLGEAWQRRMERR